MLRLGGQRVEGSRARQQILPPEAELCLASVFAHEIKQPCVAGGHVFKVQGDDAEDNARALRCNCGSHGGLCLR